MFIVGYRLGRLAKDKYFTLLFCSVSGKETKKCKMEEQTFKNVNNCLITNIYSY
jgi:hypothetical protein